jgi:hypothetical protein
MTEYHKFQQKGVGVSRGGRNENLNHDDRNQNISDRLSGGFIQLPPLPPLNQVELSQQPKSSPPSTPLSPMWQKEPANVKENVADMGQSLQAERPMVNSPLIQVLDDFFLYNNDHEHPIAPLTPKSLSNSPLMPAEPRPTLYDSFDSEETVYDTFGFFPSYSSIERRPKDSSTTEN